jgi:hypothetical protein
MNNLFRRLKTAMELQIPVTKSDATTEVLDQYKKYFRNKYWIGISGLNGNNWVVITKGNGTTVRLRNVKSFVELFTEIERIGKLGI